MRPYLDFGIFGLGVTELGYIVCRYTGVGLFKNVHHQTLRKMLESKHTPPTHTLTPQDKKKKQT